MTLLVILCHPNPNSFNHSLAKRVVEAGKEQGHKILFHDLYREGFDPVLSLEEIQRRISFDELVQEHGRHLEQSQGIAIIYPDWWGQPPALLKGWLDRVLRPGIAYDYEGEEFVKKQQVPLLTNKKALIFCTSDHPPESGESPMETIWKSQVLGFCGIKNVAFISMNNVREAVFAQRTEWLNSAAEIIRGWSVPHKR